MYIVGNACHVFEDSSIKLHYDQRDQRAYTLVLSYVYEMLETPRNQPIHRVIMSSAARMLLFGVCRTSHWPLSSQYFQLLNEQV